ncbi:MAG TPA: transglycosylase SLT domain-containing protein [Casimicrobiaceae bacterium]|nr:transglycosylase SLT domain-containing protein [Casimicrobiaceae bacterium]
MAFALASCATLPGTTTGAETTAAPAAAPAPIDVEPTIDLGAEPAATWRPTPEMEDAMMLAHAVVAPSVDEPAVSIEDPNAITVPLPPANGNLWERIRAGFAMPDLDTPEVRKAADWYAANPEYVGRMVERSRRYLYYIVGQVEKRGMPMEIALLPMIESAFNPMAYSRSRASGIWQFMPSTGKIYGMQQNWWFDERRNIVAATDGALDYLEKLYQEFGDWRLALAAYNWGEGSVRRAVAANAKRRLPTDYLSLKMPAETRGYVPKLQAIENIVRDPKAYGLKFADIPDAPYFSVVRTSRKMDVKIAAELADMPLDEFLSLNPQHNRPVIAGADEASILLPYDKAGLFAAKLELSDQPMVTWQAYKLKSGETLQQVATRFGLPLETLRAVNGIGTRAKVPVNHTLLVPSQVPSRATAETLQSAVFTTVPEGRTFYHHVRNGETLYGIAARYHVSAEDLKTWNPDVKGKLMRGQRLRVISDAAPAGGKSKHGSKSRKRATATALGAGKPSGSGGGKTLTAPR